MDRVNSDIFPGVVRGHLHVVMGGLRMSAKAVMCGRWILQVVMLDSGYQQVVMCGRWILHVVMLDSGYLQAVIYGRWILQVVVLDSGYQQVVGGRLRISD